MAKITEKAKFSDVAYMFHMQVHLDYAVRWNSVGFTCHMCRKYPLPRDLKPDDDEEEVE